ncbi:hypothetical protein ACLOJK_033387 [Asimina triloba]
MASKRNAAVLLFLTLAYLNGAYSTGTPCPPKKTQPKSPPAAPSKSPTCPKDTLKWGACIDLLAGLVHLVEAAPPSSKCCSLVKGLADLEAAVCLCTTIKANALAASVDPPVALSLLVNSCGKKIPPGYKCA